MKYNPNHNNHDYFFSQEWSVFVLCPHSLCNNTTMWGPPASFPSEIMWWKLCRLSRCLVSSCGWWWSWRSSAQTCRRSLAVLSRSTCSPLAGAVKTLRQRCSNCCDFKMLIIAAFCAFFPRRIPLWGGVLITIIDTFVFLFLDKYGTLCSLSGFHILSQFFSNWTSDLFLCRAEETGSLLWLAHHCYGRNLRLWGAMFNISTDRMSIIDTCCFLHSPSHVT